MIAVVLYERRGRAKAHKLTAPRRIDNDGLFGHDAPLAHEHFEAGFCFRVNENHDAAAAFKVVADGDDFVFKERFLRASDDECVGIWGNGARRR